MGRRGWAILFGQQGALTFVEAKSYTTCTSAHIPATRFCGGWWVVVNA